jgi:phage tail P2-like protein
MADERLLPPPVADERGLAFLEALDRLAELDLTPLLVYRLESVPESALYALAWQLGVLGPAGWDLAETAEQRRDLLRRAIQLHRRKGTPWAVRESLRALGYPDAAVVEETGLLFCFRVHLGLLQDGDAIPAERQALLLATVAAWQNVRSHLLSLDFDTPEAGDQLPLPQDEPMEIMQREFNRLDGSWTLNGSRNLGGVKVDSLGAV